jgi:hypothetical protein
MLIAAATVLVAVAAFAQQKAEPKKDAKPAEAVPAATVKLEGRTVTRTKVTDDPGTRLVWRVAKEYVDEKTRKAAKSEEEVDARATTTYTHADTGPGKYTITLEIFSTLKAGRNKDGYHTANDPRTSKLVPIAPAVSYVIPGGPAAEPEKAAPKADEKKAEKK